MKDATNSPKPHVSVHPFSEWLGNRKGHSLYIDKLVDNKITLIRHTRLLTAILGKLGIKCLRRENYRLKAFKTYISLSVVPLVPRPPSLCINNTD